MQVCTHLFLETSSFALLQLRGQQGIVSPVSPVPRQSIIPRPGAVIRNYETVPPMSPRRLSTALLWTNYLAA